jgi:hypothetical protein
MTFLRFALYIQLFMHLLLAGSGWRCCHKDRRGSGPERPKGRWRRDPNGLDNDRNQTHLGLPAIAVASQFSVKASRVKKNPPGVNDGRRKFDFNRTINVNEIVGDDAEADPTMHSDRSFA